MSRAAHQLAVSPSWVSRTLRSHAGVRWEEVAEFPTGRLARRMILRGCRSGALQSDGSGAGASPGGDDATPRPECVDWRRSSRVSQFCPEGESPVGGTSRRMLEAATIRYLPDCSSQNNK